MMLDNDPIGDGAAILEKRQAQYLKSAEENDKLADHSEKEVAYYRGRSAEYREAARALAGQIQRLKA